MTDFSTYPYYDDYETSAKGKNYHKILFVPGNAVQARELTQIQSMLQEQVKRQGDAIFKNGTVIQPGHIYYDNSVVSLKMIASYGAVTIDSIGASLIGKELVGTSGVVAHVLHYEAATATDSATLFVKYKSANGTVQEFNNGEVLTNLDLNVSTQISSSLNSVGIGSLASISAGIYYVNGYFVGIDDQIIVLDKYTNTPSYTVGLQFNEAIITASDDATLYDNALGFPNYAATGASRYQITLTLVAKNLDYSDLAGQALVTFIPLMKIDTGVIQYLINDTAYSEIEKMLARRTYDESGDYIVNDFMLSTKMYRSNNRGQWVTSTPYIQGDYVTNAGIIYQAVNSGYSGATTPVHTYGQISDGSIYWLQLNVPKYNGGLLVTSSALLQDHIADEQKVSLQISSGKAYIKGFEVNKQEKTNLVIDKARDVQQISGAQIYAPEGSFVYINTVTGIIDTSTMTQINLTDGATVRGTAFATTMEYVSGTPGTAGAVYKLYLLNIQMQHSWDIHSGITNAVSTTGTTFACVFQSVSSLLDGTVSASAVITGKGTLFTQIISIGHIVQFNNVTRTVLSVDSDTQITLTANAGATLNDISMYLMVLEVHNIGNYIQPLPNNYMRSIKKADGTFDATYIVEKTFAPPTISGTSYAYALSTAGETFAGITGHIVTDIAGSGTIINAGYSLNSSATILTITGLQNGHNYKIIARVIRSSTAAREKSKTLATKTIIATATNLTDDLGTVLSTAYNYTSNFISLTKCDVQRIIKVTLSGSTGAYNATGESDVTNWFVLNMNNYVAYYGISNINRKPNVIVPSCALKITFEYFEHSTGDFFSVDSYASVPYNKIPVETIGGVGYNLCDCLDFRSRIADDGVTFSGTGGNISTPLYSDGTIQTSYSYYLPRSDSLSLSSNGEFEYFTGGSALVPTAPVIGDGSLILAQLDFDPYTLNADTNIFITPSPHRRYTMQDISDLDTRLSNVEYYVSLTELEKSTSYMQVFDDNGLSRYKNGFIADPFDSLDIGDVVSDDFRCAIDINNNLMRPMGNDERIPLVEPSGSTDSSRQASGYQVTGDWITLPYTEVPLVSQATATRKQNVNPFAIFSWNGFAKLTPQKDNWVDTHLNTVVQDVVGTTYTKNVYDFNWWGWGWRWWGFNNN